MDELDKILKKIVHGQHSARHAEEGKDCVSEERFAEYLENLLDPLQKEKVERHLTECETCFQKSIMFSKVTGSINKEKQSDISEIITEKAKSLVRAQSPVNIIEVVLEFGKNIVNIMKDAANVCTVPEPAAFASREGESTQRGTNIAKLSKEFEGLKADISVEKINGSVCEIEAKMSDPASGSLVDDIRVNLVSDEKELASYLTVKGSVNFKNLEFGNYLIKVYKGKHPIGEVFLKLSSIQ